MEKLGNVQQKVSCVFETRVVEEPSGKRSYQPYKVVAGEKVRPDAELSNIFNSIATEKLDGTCVYIAEFDGTPWLWARHDRKPNKNADRKFKKFQNTRRGWLAGGKDGPEPTYKWDLTADFKDVPHYWVPAAGVCKNDDGLPLPDDNGHIPGWVPIDPKGRQHCWHASSVDIEVGLALVMQPLPDDKKVLQITATPLADLIGCTMELIGTHINGNPYQLGVKQSPLHLLVRHGAITFQKAPPLDFSDLTSWFSDDSEGSVEGIVWHCSDGKLFKVHRHHLGLKWPAELPRLQTFPVKINVDISKYLDEIDPTTVIGAFGKLSNQQFESLGQIQLNAVSMD